MKALSVVIIQASPQKKTSSTGENIWKRFLLYTATVMEFLNAMLCNVDVGLLLKSSFLTKYNILK